MEKTERMAVKMDENMVDFWINFHLGYIQCLLL